MTFRTEVLATRDGAEIAYRIRPGRDPWVLLHGLGCDGSMWDGVVAALPEEIGLVIPDLRGHGGSTLGSCLPSVDRWGEDVLEVLDKEGIERAGIAGLSMGGYTALAMAAAAPDLARGYAFISTSAAPDDDAARARRAKGIAALARHGARAFAIGLVPALLAEDRPGAEAHQARLLAMFERAGAVGLAATLLALANRPDRRPLLPRLRAGSLVIVGDRDALIPPERAKELAASAPRSRLVVLPGIAHMSAMEAPAEVARELARGAP